MEATLDTPGRIYALEPFEALCARCREQTTTRVIILPRATAAARAPRPLHASVYRFRELDEDDLANATWEDAAWQ